MYTLTVTLPSLDYFNAYWYGYGTVRSNTENSDGSTTYVIEYDAGELFNAQCQNDRFWSGLFPSKLSEIQGPK